MSLIPNANILRRVRPGEPISAEQWNILVGMVHGLVTSRLDDAIVDSSGIHRRHRRPIDGRAGKIIRVNVEAKCGLSGDQNTFPNYHYQVTDLNGNNLIFNDTDDPVTICGQLDPPQSIVIQPGDPLPVEPEMRLFPFRVAAATIGFGYYNGGTFVLSLVDEVPGIVSAPVDLCS